MKKLTDHILDHAHYQGLESVVFAKILKEITKNQYAVIRYLMRFPEYVPPTTIGNDVAGNGKHSAWASPICKVLVKKKLVTKNAKGHYRICKALLTE